MLYIGVLLIQTLFYNKTGRDLNFIIFLILICHKWNAVKIFEIVDWDSHNNFPQFRICSCLPFTYIIPTRSFPRNYLNHLNTYTVFCKTVILTTNTSIAVVVKGLHSLHSFLIIDPQRELTSLRSVFEMTSFTIVCLMIIVAFG